MLPDLKSSFKVAVWIALVAGLFWHLEFLYYYNRALYSAVTNNLPLKMASYVRGANLKSREPHVDRWADQLLKQSRYDLSTLEAVSFNWSKTDRNAIFMYLRNFYFKDQNQSDCLDILLRALSGERTVNLDKRWTRCAEPDRPSLA
ncbi:MAG: hypothetical protein ACRD1R_19425, partial [Acidobacteriota bacterium]